MVDIAVIPGDGIGKEIMPEVCNMLKNIDSSLNFYYYDISSERYKRTGKTVTDNEITELKGYKSILFGAIGSPDIKPGIMERNVILKLRRELDLYMNIRPAKSFNKISKNNINITIFRENMEDFYTEISGKVNENREFKKINSIYNYNIKIDGKSSDNIYYNLGILTEKNIKRFFKKAFSLIKNNNITVTDKANAIEMYNFWRKIAVEMAIKENKNIKFEYADALAYNLIIDPGKYESIIAPNLYGDILSDMLSGITGGLGYSPSGNIGDSTSMFEPVHGSAPDIAGKNIANPVASILSASMMLDYIGLNREANIINTSIDYILDKNIIPLESGGVYGTAAIINHIEKESICRLERQGYY